MQFSNALLLVLAVAAVAVNPLLDRLAYAIATFFRRRHQRGEQKRALVRNQAQPSVAMRSTEPRNGVGVRPCVPPDISSHSLRSRRA
jgi:hypothetical protein